LRALGRTRTIPRLKQGAAKWVKKLRREYERRFEKVAGSATE
jgi:hypothetical protein